MRKIGKKRTVIYVFMYVCIHCKVYIALYTTITTENSLRSRGKNRNSFCPLPEVLLHLLLRRVFLRPFSLFSTWTNSFFFFIYRAPAAAPMPPYPRNARFSSRATNFPVRVANSLYRELVGSAELKIMLERENCGPVLGSGSAEGKSNNSLVLPAEGERNSEKEEGRRIPKWGEGENNERKETRKFLQIPDLCVLSDSVV